jgi:hypothetical protein
MALVKVHDAHVTDKAQRGHRYQKGLVVEIGGSHHAVEGKHVDVQVNDVDFVEGADKDGREGERIQSRDLCQRLQELDHNLVLCENLLVEPFPFRFQTMALNGRNSAQNQHF